MFCSTDPVNDTNGGKVFMDAIRTSTNMDLAWSLNDAGGAAPTERMRLTGAGSLGIGTASPSNKLDVVGVIRATNGSIIANTGATVNAQFILSDNGTNKWQTYYDASAGSYNIYSTTASSVRLSIDSSGNVGIGVTPSAWGSFAITQYKGGFIGSQSSSYLYIGQNTYFNGTDFKYVSTAAVTMLEQSFGAFVFLRAASGTAGNTVSFSESCRIDSSGNLLVGVTSASYSSANRGVVNLGGSASGLLGFQIGGVAKGYVAHFDSSMQIWNEVASPILFGTSATERVRIDSSGNLLVGRTTTPADGLARIAVLNTTDTAIQLTKSGVVSCRITAISTALAFGVDGSDGATERMRIDTTQVKATVPFIGNSGTKGFGGITTTTSTSTPTGGSSGDHYYIY